jgi:hypothetical protein
MARIEAVPGTVPAGETPRFAPCTGARSEMYRRTYQLKTKAPAGTGANTGAEVAA